MPDHIVDYDRFAGRQNHIQDFTNILLGLSKKQSHNVLIKGEKWIGKSSLVTYVQKMCEKKYPTQFLNYCVCYCRLGGCQTIEDICQIILKEFENIEVKNKSIWDKLREVRGFSISTPIGGISFDIDRNEKDYIIPNFPYLIESIFNNLQEEYKGFIIILDETEKIAKKEYFGSFIKNLIEHLHGKEYRNFSFILTLTPRGVNECCKDHPSFSRLFIKTIELDKLSKDESRELIYKALKKGKPKKKIEKRAIENVIGLCDGIPGFLQEVGYHCFEISEDNKITLNDAIRGIVGDDDYHGALDTIYKKHFQTYMEITNVSQNYRNILNVFAEKYDKDSISKIYLSHKTKIDETKIGKYLKKLKKHNIIEDIPGRPGDYRVTSTMLKAWLYANFEYKKL